MSTAQMIIYIILGFIIGILLPHIVLLILDKIKKRDTLEKKIKALRSESIKPIIENEDITHVVIGPDTIERLAKHTIVYDIPQNEAKALIQIGLLERVGGGYIVDTEAVSHYIERIKSIEIRERHIDVQTAKYLLSRYGVANMLIYSISREIGLTQLYRLAETKLTERIDREPSFVDNLYMISTEGVMDIGDMKVAIIPKNSYFFIIELTPTANPEHIINAIKRLDKIPDNVEQLKDILTSL